MQNLFYDRNTLQTWTYISNTGFTRLPSPPGPGDGVYYINNEFDIDGFLYKQNKNYQFTTGVTGSITNLTLKLSTPFIGGILAETRSLSGSIVYYNYASPITTEQSTNIIKYGAIETFTYSYITKSIMCEVDFYINGFREFEYTNLPKNDISQPNGWCYEVDNLIGMYSWYYSSLSSVISPSYSINGSGLSDLSPNNNYIATLINYDYFNLDFQFNATLSGNTGDIIQIYLVDKNDLMLNNWIPPIVPIASLTSSGTFSFVNLQATAINGVKKYLVFKASMSVLSRSQGYVGSISNIRIVGGYNPQNNLQIIPSSDLQVDILDSVYSFQSVTNGITYSLSSKIGNGTFKAGIWENGVWNNGWRDDTEVKDFDDVYSSILYAYDISWKIKISGSTYSCGYFNIGDKVSIGNIVAIDINENRKLIRDYYTINDIDSNLSWIEVTLDTTFPYRRIEKDSSNHKIKITKNIWLSGAFFNGYFSGVWNSGLFKGYPKITEMFDTYWIDGFFNGGHFNSNYPEFKFIDIIGTDNCNVNNITLVFESHNLLPGDYIIIDKDLSFNSGVPTLINEQYNGIAKVLAVNGNNVIVNKRSLSQIFSNGFRIPEKGKVTRYSASSVIQNFKFYDTNRSKLKSNESTISSSIFSFNSWIDTNYDSTRSVTLGRDFRSFEPLTGKSINRNNLFGYPTYDILSSASRFRNSFDLDYGLYKLGTKYKIFTDFIGDDSKFNDPFDPALENISNFYNAGWTFSYRNNTDLSFNRTESLISYNVNNSISNIQTYIDSGVTGNELYITATNSGTILNNSKISTTKSRYTIVEFDVVTYSIADYKFTYTNQNAYNILSVGQGGVFSAPATQSVASNTSLTASNITSFDTQLNVGSINFMDGFNGEVWSIDRQSDGKIIVSGNFTTYNGTSTPLAKICRLNSNGTIDTSFNPTINDLNITNINFIKVLVVKNFTTLNDKIFLAINYNIGVSVNGYSSVLGRTVRLDSDGTYSGSISSYQKEFNNTITDIAIRPTDGLLIIVGKFTGHYYNLTNTFWMNKIVLFSVLGAFSGSNLYNGLIPYSVELRGFATNDIPSTIATLNDGTFIVGGRITSFRTNPGNTYYLNGVVHLNTPSNGYVTVHTTLVTGSSTVANIKGFAFTPGTLLPNSSYNFINKIIVDNLNRIYVIGKFSSYNDGSPHACYNIVNLGTTGYYNSFFVSGQGLNDDAYDIQIVSNKIYVSGKFTRYNTQDCGKVISIRTTGLLESSIGTLNSSTSKVTTLSVSANNIIVGGLFDTYQPNTTSITKTILTSDYVQSLPILSADIINISVMVSLDCTGSDLGNITINLKSPDGNIINLKSGTNANLPLSLLAQTKLTNTVFDYSSNTLLSSGVEPYTGTFSMSRELSRGAIGYLSDSTTLSQLVTTSAAGTWTIFIQNDNMIYPTLISWGLIITYKGYIDDPIIDSSPSVDLPIIHFNNLNYEIGSQPTGTGQTNPIYRKMSYLPITQNINHLSVKNTFRFDSIEKTSAERYNGFGTNTINKKYEYFYNKTDLMMSIQGNGILGSSQSMLILDNIKMYESDMIPFFKYFEDVNIYKGIQVPYEGIAPNIDYLNSDFIFIDNITIGLDTINDTIIDTNINCVPNVITIIESSITPVTSVPSNITTNSVTIGGIVNTQGIVNYQSGGVYISLTQPASNNTLNLSPPFTLVANIPGSRTLTGLLPNTTYYVQAYAFGSITSTTGVLLSPEFILGQTYSFTTGALPPDYSNDYSVDYSQ